MTDPNQYPGTRRMTGPTPYPHTEQGYYAADAGQYSAGYPVPEGGGYPVPEGYGYPVAGPPAPNRTPQVLAAIAAVVALGAVAALVYLFTRPDDAASQATPSEAPNSVVTVTQAAPSTHVETVDPEPVTPKTVTTTVPHSGGSVTVSGADNQGFYGGPRCNAPEDPVVFVGRTSRSRVAICQVGNQVGRNYYKGLADGDAIEIGYPSRSGNSFTAVNGNVSYTVSPSALVITQNGSVIANETMIESWVD